MLEIFPVNLILTNIYIFILAVTLAIVEIQSEGPHGWAKNFPTWRPAPHKWYTKIYSIIASGKELTGYHLSLFIFVFLMFHLPYFYGLDLNIVNYSKTLSIYLIFAVMWDFLWFVLNPHYPLSKFKKEHISWHKKWTFGAPVDYYGILILSLLVSTIPSFITYITGSVSNLQLFTSISWWLNNVALFATQTLILILFTLHILKIDNWNLK